MRGSWDDANIGELAEFLMAEALAGHFEPDVFLQGEPVLELLQSEIDKYKPKDS